MLVGILGDKASKLVNKCLLKQKWGQGEWQFHFMPENHSELQEKSYLWILGMNNLK